jgi:hypothetical protein
VPKLVVRVVGAEPPLALLAEQRRGGIARFIQMRDALTKWFGFLAGIFFGRLCFHGRTCGDILLLEALKGDTQAILRADPIRTMKYPFPGCSCAHPHS